MQAVAVMLLVAAAGGYVVRATLRTWRTPAAGGCGAGCGKCGAPSPAEAPRPGRVSLV